MKKMIKDIGRFGSTSVGLGVTSMIAAKTGVSGATTGLAAVGDMMPTVSTAMMGKHALRMVKRYKK